MNLPISTLMYSKAFSTAASSLGPSFEIGATTALMGPGRAHALPSQVCRHFNIYRLSLYKRISDGAVDQLRGVGGSADSNRATCDLLDHLKLVGQVIVAKRVVQ